MTRKSPLHKRYYGDYVGLYNSLAPLMFKKNERIYSTNGFARIFGIHGLKPSNPFKDTYDKNLYILTNANSFSATAEVCGILRNHDRANFIGEESGGNINQNTAGYRFKLILPNTGITAYIPSWLFELEVEYENTGHGIIPDYIINPSIDDRINNVDTALDFTYDLIQKRRLNEG